MYDDNHGIDYHLGGSDEYVNPFIFQNGTTKITVTIKRLPYFKTGLFETFTPRSTFVRQFVVEDLPFNLYNQPSFYFDKTNKHLWIFSNTTGFTYYAYWGLTYPTYDNTNIKYAKIDCNENVNAEDRILASGTIVSDTANIAPTGMYKTRSTTEVRGDHFNQIIYDGTNFYFPTSSGAPNYTDEFMYIANARHNGFKRINFGNQSDQEWYSFNTEKAYITNGIKCGELLVENNRVVNDGVGYTCTGILPETVSSGMMANGLLWQFQELNKACSLVFPLYSDNGGTSARYILASKLINSTKFNLPSTVQKTASQSMTVEYTLTEQ